MEDKKAGAVRELGVKINAVRSLENIDSDFRLSRGGK